MKSLGKNLMNFISGTIFLNNYTNIIVSIDTTVANLNINKSDGRTSSAPVLFLSFQNSTYFPVRIDTTRGK